MRVTGNQAFKRTTMRPWPFVIVVCASGGAVLGACVGQGAALLAGVGGAILGWAVVKGVVVAAVRGIFLGAGFAVVVGPLADRMISGRPIHETLWAALVVGTLVGGLLGVRNARRKRPTGLPADSGPAT